MATPHVARMYDWFLGGKDNYTADREAGEKVLQALPQARIVARLNRAFLGHVVWWLASRGIRQFLDIGTGIPTSPNVNEVAQQVTPDARVVYVDNDPHVLVHADALLARDPRTIVIGADLRDPWAIVTDPAVRGHLDFSQPVALLLVAVLHFVEDDAAAYEIIKILLNRLAPGSYLVISHLLAAPDHTGVEAALQIYKNSNAPVVSRTHEQVARFFDQTKLDPPGLVHARDWLISRAVADNHGNATSIYDRSELLNVPLICGLGLKTT